MTHAADCGALIERLRYSSTLLIGDWHDLLVDAADTLEEMHARENKQCYFCGSTDYYAKGLCKKCYQRLRHSGTLEYRHGMRGRPVNPDKLKEYWEKNLKDADLSRLNERQRRVLIQRYHDGQKMTAVAEREGISRQRAHQIVRTALAKVNRKHGLVLDES